MSQPSTAVAERPDTSTEIAPWRDALRSQGGALHAFLPSEEVRNRFLRVVAQAIERNPDLAECTPDSLASAAVEAAMYGLEPSGAAGGAHLVPFNTKVKRGGREVWEKRAQLIVDYRGQLQLARDSEKVEDAYAVVVRQKDHFRYDAANGLIEHVPDLQAAQSPNPDDAANPMTHVYGVLVFRSGYRRVEVMSKAQVDAVRAMSKAANGPAWTNSYLEMAKKTVMHRGLKTAPLRPGARAILERDPDFDFEGPRVTVEPVAPARPQLAERLRQKRLGTSDPGESDASVPTGGAEAGETASAAPTAGSPACKHPAKKQQATDAGIVCGECGTLLAAREAEAPKPRARARKAKTPDEDGYHRARAHALADERGLDPDALKRVAGDVLGYEGDWSRTQMVEADWEQVVAAIQAAPVRVEDEDAWKEASTVFAGSQAIVAGIVKVLGDDPSDWDPVDASAAAMFSDDVEKLDPSDWIEYGLRIGAKAAVPA